MQASPTGPGSRVTCCSGRRSRPRRGGPRRGRGRRSRHGAVAIIRRRASSSCAVHALRRGRVLHTAVREPVHELAYALSGRRLDGQRCRVHTRAVGAAVGNDAARPPDGGGASASAGVEPGRPKGQPRNLPAGRAEAPVRSHVVGNATAKGRAEAGAEDGGRAAREAGGRVGKRPPPRARAPAPCGTAGRTQDDVVVAGTVGMMIFVGQLVSVLFAYHSPARPSRGPVPPPAECREMMEPSLAARTKRAADPATRSTRMSRRYFALVLAMNLMVGLSSPRPGCICSTSAIRDSGASRWPFCIRFHVPRRGGAVSGGGGPHRLYCRFVPARRARS